MKYSIEAMTIDIEFKWRVDKEGDWRLSYKTPERINDKWELWDGLLCPHHKNHYEIVVDGRLCAEFPTTLKAAKSYAERICAGDILRNLAKIKKETDGLSTDN